MSEILAWFSLAVVGILGLIFGFWEERRMQKRFESELEELFQRYLGD